MTTLAELIAADPDEVGYAQMTAAEVAADLNERRHTTHTSRVVTLANLLTLGSEAAGTMLNALEAAAAVSPGMKWTLRALENNGLDLGHPTALAEIQGLVGTLFTQEQVDALLSLTLQAVSLAEVNGIASPVTPEGVERARGEG